MFEMLLLKSQPIRHSIRGERDTFVGAVKLVTLPRAIRFPTEFMLRTRVTNESQVRAASTDWRADSSTERWICQLPCC